MNSLTSRSKPISQILKPSSRTLYISLFSTSTPSSSSSSSSSFHNSSRRHDEESRGVRVSVWWDIENCGVPTGINVFRIAHSITSAVRANGIKGPVHITAFGDIFCINRASQEALTSTGVNLVHIPSGGKNSADRSLLVDLMYWVSQNPPPAHIFLISGDRDFAGILHKLRMSNYNILLAAREAKQTPGVLYSAASIMWHWSELAKGENLSGKHFNQPPDGPFNSWYGHYRGPLEDPFAMCQQQKCSEAGDSSNGEQSADNRYRPVPMAVLRQLRRVVNSHPEGLSITELRTELQNSKVLVDKDFYGYKKFSRLLQALPRIVTVESRPDGQFFLQPVSATTPKLAESNDTSAEPRTVNCNRATIPEVAGTNDISAQPMTVNGNRGARLSGKANTETTTITRMVNVEEPMSLSVEEASEKKVSDASPKENDMASKDSNSKSASNAEKTVSPMIPTEEHNSKHKNGVFRILWTKMFPQSIDTGKKGNDDPGRHNTSSGSPEKSLSDEEQSKSSNHSTSSSNTTLHESAKVDTMEKPEASPSFIGKIINWCKFWRNEPSSDKGIGLPDKDLSAAEEHTRKFDDALHSKKLEDDASHSIKHELFTKDTFWNALRSYFKTHRGSEIVLNAMSRQQLAERLQKEGPLFLRSLQAIDICHLVDVLVSEKKWIQEFPTKNPCFKVINLSDELLETNLSDGRSASDQPHSLSASAQPHTPAASAQPHTPAASAQPHNPATFVQPHNNPTGLSSIFLNSPSHQNPQMRAPSIVHMKPSEKSRSEILADCQKLLDELLTQHRHGFNMGIFKKHFLDKYGYALDHQKLGYLKLVSLLQMMPGVKVESNLILPDSVVYAPGIQFLGSKEKSTGSDSDMSDTAPKDDDVESPWEELGPVAKSNLAREEAKSSPERVNGVYEPSMSDDDELSDMEGEESSLSIVKVDEQSKSRVDEEDSSLLQILDSWYSTKDESNQRDHSSDPETCLSSSEDESSPPGSPPAGVKGNVAPAYNNGRKHKPQKSFTFVAEPTEAKKDKLIDGILGSLKKSGESRVHS